MARSLIGFSVRSSLYLVPRWWGVGLLMSISLHQGRIVGGVQKLSQYSCLGLAYIAICFLGISSVGRVVDSPGSYGIFFRNSIGRDSCARD